jgi:hypothetical protein
MKDRAQVNIFAQGDVTCAVCAPAATPGDFLVGFVEAMNPTRIGRGWSVFDGDLPDGGGNPRACQHDPGRRHWFLVRGALAAGLPEPVNEDWPPDVSRETCEDAEPRLARGGCVA